MSRMFGRLCSAMVFVAAACTHARQVAPPRSSALNAVDVGESGVPFAPAPEGLLRPSAARDLQTALRTKGYLDREELSGTLDPATREALRRFQLENDLPATGLPSYRTVDKLGLGTDAVFFSQHNPPALEPRKSVDQGSVGTR